MHVWRRASGGDVMENTMLVDGQTEVGSKYARELRENGGPLVVILGVDMWHSTVVMSGLSSRPACIGENGTKGAPLKVTCQVL